MELESWKGCGGDWEFVGLEELERGVYFEGRKWDTDWAGVVLMSFSDPLSAYTSLEFE